jgi:two-component system LytT family response regulator
MLHAIITDDEAPARQLIREFLNGFEQITIIAECHNGRECVERVNALKPDLLFLDIQMPVLTGFEALAQLEHVPLVIFSTAYDHYALTAFEVSAVDYLLKPYTKERFQTAVERALKRLAERNTTPSAAPTDYHAYDAYIAQLTQLLATTHSQHTQGKHLQTFMVRHGQKIVAVRVEEIERIEAADDYAALHVGGVKYLAVTGLATLEQRLNPQIFKRVHRSAILNIQFVRHIEPDASGGMTATMQSGAKVKISRSYVAEFKKLLI